jgi:hypothetical protein
MKFCIAGSDPSLIQVSFLFSCLAPPSLFHKCTHIYKKTNYQAPISSVSDCENCPIVVSVRDEKVLKSVLHVVMQDQYSNHIVNIL